MKADPKRKNMLIVNTSFCVSDDDNIPRRVHNENREVNKLWSSPHCHWVPSGPGLSLKIMENHTQIRKWKEWKKQVV